MLIIDKIIGDVKKAKSNFGGKIASNFKSEN